MNATFKATDPDSIEFTAEITLPMSAWRAIADRMKNSGNGELWDLRCAILSMVEGAEREFRPSPEPSELQTGPLP